MSSEENEQNFILKDLVPISLDRNTVYIYPKITSDMISAEKQYGLLVTKAALETAFRQGSVCLESHVRKKSEYENPDPLSNFDCEEGSPLHRSPATRTTANDQQVVENNGRIPDTSSGNGILI